MNHKWVAQKPIEGEIALGFNRKSKDWNQIHDHNLRTYYCEKCGVGPVVIDVLSDKRGITAAAKRRGISPDCNIEQVRKVMES